jgi:DNA-binding SARP family transcriptional activator
MAGGLPRDRLDSRLASAQRHRLTLVVGPAGSGKTTLLARYASISACPVAWYRAEQWDRDEPVLLRHLEAALKAALQGLRGGWASVEDAAASLEAWDGGQAVLVIDDLHALEGTAAEAALGHFVEYAPPALATLAATRMAPSFNLSRMRIAGQLLEIQNDDLRFRAWEVERLFREFYGDPVPPEEAALLARRTEGWAAGLQLFHLATRGKPPEDRRRILGVVGSSTRLVREYLTQNVLAELPDELARFLLDTCVLGRLTGDVCDRWLGRLGSARLLEDLARRQIFTVAIDEQDGSYRYHEVLRGHLDRMLVDDIGEQAWRARHARAGAILEEFEALPEALAAYCRAEDWPAVRRLLVRRGEQVAGDAELDLERLPPSLVHHDPWLALASARRARAEGRWQVAVEAYARAEAAFGTAATGAISRLERQALVAWLDPAAKPPSSWSGVLRAGLVRDPIAMARSDTSLDAGHRDLARGLLLLAGGNIREARVTLARASEQDGLGRPLTIAASLGAGLAGLLAGDPHGGVEVEMAVEAAEHAGLDWLAEIGRIVGHLPGGRTADLGAAADALADPTDPWGRGIAALVDAWCPPAPEPRPWDASPAAGPAINAAEVRLRSAEAAAAVFRRLGVGVLEAWAAGLIALGQAESDAPDARQSAIAAEVLARATAAPGPRQLAYAALARSDPERGNEYEPFVEALQRETGLTLPPPAGLHAATSLAAGAPTDGLRIRTLGRFDIEAAGRSISLDEVKPRARAVLRFLVMHGGAPVHREVIQEALWPEVDADAGARSLHVAISGLRGAFGRAFGPGAAGIVARDGDAYRLALRDDAIDLARFDRAMSDARAAARAGDIATGVTAYRSALAIYAGDLLPEDGPAEWVVERREHYRREAVQAARAVAEASLLAGDLDGVVAACRAGLELDRYHDPLWRLLIAARERAGDAGAAGRDRREYEAVLSGLGVTVGVTPSA